MKSLAGIAQLYKARPGFHGSSKAQHGGVGDSTVVLVPLGTVVSRVLDDAETQQATTGVSTEDDTQSWTRGGRGSGTGDAEEGTEPATEPAEEVPAWLARWRTAYTADAEDIDRDDGFADPADGTERSATAGTGSDDAGGEAAPKKHRGPRRYPTEILADLVEDGQEIVVARGGRGGMGNAAMRAKPNRPAPRESTPGASGERVRLLLEMKILADIGLVGLPNAGKSSLLRALTAARPKVGSYAFTTLMPQLGVVDLGWGERMVIADVPGLIAGAAQNKGLGHAFLRHIERTRVLAYVLDAAAGLHGAPGLRPWKQLELLQEEIEAYSPALAALPALVIANKMDLVPHPARTLCALRARTHLPVLPASAVQGEGVPGTLAALRTLWAGEELTSAMVCEDVPRP